jgi:hypothetical protein
MSTVIKILFLIFLTTNCFAEQYYIYIEKFGVVEPGQESGQPEKGDVIAVKKVSDGKPSPSEESGYNIVIVDMTSDEAYALINPVYDKNYGNGSQKVIKAREFKVDTSKLNLNKQEQVIVKSTFTSNISDKSVIVAVNP